jgi:membrane-bound lytic murein transglycosylase A
MRWLLLLVLTLGLAACGEEEKAEQESPAPAPAPAAAPAPTPQPAPAPQVASAPDCRCEEQAAAPALELTPASFAALPGWADDDLAQALPALLASCRALLAEPAEAPVGPRALAGTAADWRAPCQGLAGIAADSTVLRPFLESWFRPFLASDRGQAVGLFTGYYEPEVAGSLTRAGDYLWPLYAPPADLLRVRLGRFRADLEGESLYGRLEGKELVPYHDRATIDEAHVLAGQGLELLWLRDYVELFFLQVQGSGIVAFPDGSRRRVGFAAANGLPFTAIGRLLKESGKLAPGEATAQGVMAWLRAHPAEAWEMMQQNRRYIFFRMLEGEGPLGAQGVALTPGRSLAVDPALLPLGAPFWLDTTMPGGGQPLRRLVVAQDSGAAIKGAVRGDLFWGAGEPALAEAGRMQQKGRYWLLLPAAVAERRQD